MSLSELEAPSVGDQPGPSFTDEFVCKTSENLFAAIEKCLDNGLGTCLVVEGENRLVGRISLDDIGRAVLDGALLNPSLDKHMATLAHQRHNDTSADKDVLRKCVPVADSHQQHQTVRNVRELYARLANAGLRHALN